MFEHDQEIVQRLLAEDPDFKSLHARHQELNDKVDKAGSGVLPLDDVTVENMKKEKLKLMDRMAIRIHRYRQQHKPD